MISNDFDGVFVLGSYVFGLRFVPSKSDTPEFSQKYKNTSLSLLGVRIVKSDMKKGRAKKKKKQTGVF